MHRCCAHHERSASCTPNLYVYTLPEAYRDVDDLSPGRGVGSELLSPSETRNLLPGFEDHTGCAKGATKGSWSMHDLSDEQLLDECTQECLKCDRCNFISVSRPYSDCSWFEECDLSNLEAAPRHQSLKVDRTAAAPS